jgi:cephalosporin hydroxylase
MTQDDREEFLAASRAKALEMIRDPEVARLDAELTAVSDRYDYSYMWRWLGLPIIQMPADVVVTQELIWDLRPDVIVETGVARGGSAVFHASMLQLLGHGHVVAVDIDIRPHNREAIESHPLAHRIRLIEGSSVDEEVLDRVRKEIGGAQRVMVVLDSNHTHEHVLAELNAYASVVTSGQFLVVADTLVETLPVQEHRPRPWGRGDNPKTALDAFLRERSDAFEVDEVVNGKLLLTSSRGGYLRRR